MADQAGATGGTPRQDGQRGRGRGQGRGRGGAFRVVDNRQHDNPRGRGGARGGGRVGHRGGANSGDQTTQKTPESKQLQPTIKPSDQDVTEDLEAEVCFICASPVVHSSVAPCNHRTCHICALRMRALYKTKECPHCRTPAPYVIFTDDATKRFEDFTNAEGMPTDESIGIRYESEEIQMDTRILLRYNCPDRECDVACLSWPDLHKHVRAVHQKKICDLCSRHKKVFTHEHELYTDKELNQHLTKGDDNPGAVDQSGFKGHPSCGFCKLRFYGEDELYVHCRESHERCFICDRRPGAAVYYLNYDSLEEHFKLAHFQCLEPVCLEKKFIVFPAEIDLKAHQLQEHGNTLSKDVRRDARIVDISGFDYRTPYVQERRGGSSQRELRGERARGGGRRIGRDPNAEPLPASSAQPLPRDQQAFQRQMAIHSAQSISTRTFGGQLTPAPPARAQAHSGARDPPTVGVNPSAGVQAATAAVRNLDLAQADPEPLDQARALRHHAVIERATILLQNDELKVAQFRNLVSSFKSSAITARSLIDSFFGLFSDTSSNALGTLLRELADLYEDRSKADSLRTAWNDWRAINEDYPSLPGPAITSSAFPGNWAVTTSSTSSNPSTSAPKSTRVLKLKNSTAQSSRSSVSQTRSWGTASHLSSSSNPFPGLPPPSTSSSQATGRITTVPWIAPTSAPSSNPPSAPTSRPSSTAPGRGRAGPGSDAFPALPPANKPLTTLFGYGSGMVRRDTGTAITGNAWGQGPAENGSSGRDQEQLNGEGDIGKGKKKGNKGKKQVLMNWG